jgi:hypothetical protein
MVLPPRTSTPGAAGVPVGAVPAPPGPGVGEIPARALGSEPGPVPDFPAPALPDRRSNRCPWPCAVADTGASARAAKAGLIATRRGQGKRSFSAGAGHARSRRRDRSTKLLRNYLRFRLRLWAERERSQCLRVRRGHCLFCRSRKGPSPPVRAGAELYCWREDLRCQSRRNSDFLHLSFLYLLR